jgi:hypothetical protein
MSHPSLRLQNLSGLSGKPLDYRRSMFGESRGDELDKQTGLRWQM